MCQRTRTRELHFHIRSHTDFPNSPLRVQAQEHPGNLSGLNPGLGFSGIGNNYPASTHPNAHTHMHSSTPTCSVLSASNATRSSLGTPSRLAITLWNDSLAAPARILPEVCMCVYVCVYACVS